MGKYCCYCGMQLETGIEKFCPACGKALNARANEQKEMEAVVVSKEEKNEESTYQEVSQERKEYKNTETQEKTSSFCGFYLVDFVKNLTKIGNIPIFLYLILNVFIIGYIVQLVFKMPFWEAFFVGLTLYVISITIALSPLGEWTLRIQTGCRKIKDKEQINRLEPLFREVYEKARKLNPSIPKDVRLFLNEDESANAFATGRKTICVTKGLFRLPDAQIKATLSHEFGHLAHKDTDLILIISVGNLIIALMVTAIRLVINLMQLFLGIICIFVGGEESFITSILNAITNMMINIFVIFVMWVWTAIGVTMVMKSSRENEYRADKFAFNLGYGYELCVMLDSVSGVKSKGLFKSLVSSHPKTKKRIAHLQKEGVRYPRL